MVSINAVYVGEKHCQLTHGPSGASLETDAPKDNKGRGEAFSPTDLVASAFASCILTTMAINADAKGWELKGSYAKVIKEMTSNPRRIHRLSVEVHMPKSLSPEQRQILEDIGNHCPVHKSLHPDIECPVNYTYDL